ncbi:MAG: isoleucine--tRNA ligase [Methylotenera sp.]|nr:isoleucine--tRNA ligase [Oligoflexia bacterium]
MQSEKPFLAVRSDVQLPKQEETILAFWDQKKIFEKSLKQSESAKPYSFYDGPPFATGLPHYGHILAGVLKDVVPRYWTMKGYSIPRRFGWDCHGLPVEYEINKALKLDSRKQIIAMGVDKYNAACRGIVQRYSEEWKKTVNRVGRWVDMENAYFTMDTSFMQSVWWVFQQLWNKGLIYEGYKVVPYSVGLSSPLSNFEANQNYKQVQDPAVTVSFAVQGQAKTFFLAWTTTPWTLPSNLGLAVGKELDYVKVLEKSSGNTYILARALVGASFKNPELDVEILENVKGAALLGLTYDPLFPYFRELSAKGAFKVIHSDHVTVESGTGIVHMAPAYGEDDYYACAREGMPLVNPVDDDGMFTAEVPDYQGKRIKEADKDIIADLKKAGKLFKQDTLVHSYPFCYRSDTPLIYRAVSSWFVAVEKIKEQLIANNATTQWVPDHLRDGRFGNWLENARDWAISRNRFWGTPLPIWKNAEGEVICIGSAAELEKLTGETVTDLHIDHIDHLTIPSPTGKSPLKRVEGVLDCWFESGSMPYAQNGYPNTDPANAQALFEKTFPADFIAEGLDQTRGWFYTLMVIGTALFNKAPFKNVVVNGLILAEDGKKMSKSLKNYPDPMEVLGKHGADALRLYLIDSPVVKAQELKFAEKGVTDVVRKILLRWWNSYSFFINYANIDDFRPRGDAASSPNILDQWVLSRLNTLIENTQREMTAYRLYNVVPALLQFIEDLTNTYIRFNRSHFWQDGMPEDKRLAYETLYEVLTTLSKLMAPFAPFLAETTYQNLARVNPDAKESVHLESFPEANEKLKRPELEEAVRVMEALVVLGRNTREKIQVKAKIPLKSMTIIHRDPAVLANLKRFEAYFQDELNIQKIDYNSDEDKFIQISAKANFPVLGPRFGPKMKAIGGGIMKLGLKELLALEKGESVLVEGEAITQAEVEIRRAPKPAFPNIATHQLVSVEIDPTVSGEQIKEGLAREIVRKVQAARKAADFILDDRIALELHCTGALREAAEAHQDMIMKETLTQKFAFSEVPKGKHTEDADIDGESVKIGVTALPRG